MCDGTDGKKGYKWHSASDGLLMTTGIVPTETGATFQQFQYRLPVNEIDSVRVGTFLLGVLTLKIP
ncbi:hypothetical protein EAE89_05610 [Photorhabdus heterorhabditis]|uniref:Uncharacterized protein n=1 Tax=Photorhabdus heterorhabditis TaxID=880156 RepID=A0ABR5KEE1_9GAMM|nr:hypothetical protein AM629_06415 [Photorhabdus heterorhabditis]MBS9441217.1 hypothetical protein [Photorhabdus heterorhabditis]